MTTHTLHLPDVELVYDVHGPLPTADGRPPLLMIGQPMCADGFSSLAAQFPDRTVVTYDPRGLGRSVRNDGLDTSVPETQAADLHALITELDAGPVEVFGSSGGAVAGLALVTAHPEDVTTFVGHEPPLIAPLPDADASRRARDTYLDAYEAKGFGTGMAGFIVMSSWQGEYTDDYFAQPTPDPAAFGLPTEDDGARDDALLSRRALAVTDYELDVAALTAAPTRIVIGVGEESATTFTGRTGFATAAALGLKATMFPSHHGGFLGGEHGYAGKPEEFARTLREVLSG
jgi:pimeloyl-ACP methyl ester carboxylesterase